MTWTCTCTRTCTCTCICIQHAEIGVWQVVLYGGEPPKAVKHDGSSGKQQVYSVYMGYQWRGQTRLPPLRIRN